MRMENLFGMSEMLTLTERETSEMLLGHRQDLFCQSDDRKVLRWIPEIFSLQYTVEFSQSMYFCNTDAYTSN